MRTRLETALAATAAVAALTVAGCSAPDVDGSAAGGGDSVTLSADYPVYELVKAAANISSRNLEVMETLFAAAVWYMIIVTIASIGQFYLERAFDGSARRGRPRNLRTAIRNALVRPPFSRRGIDE